METERYSKDKAWAEAQVAEEILDSGKAVGYDHAVREAERLRDVELREITTALRSGNIDEAVSIRNASHLTPEECSQKVLIYFSTALRLGDVATAKLIRDDFHLTPDKYIHDVKRWYIFHLFSVRGNLETAQHILDEFNLIPEECKLDALRAYVDYMNQGDIDTATRIRDEFNIKSEDLDTLEDKVTPLSALNNALAYGLIREAARIRDEFNLTPEECKPIALANYLNQFFSEYGDSRTRKCICEEFHLAYEERRRYVLENLVEGMHSSYQYSITNIQKVFRFTQGELNKPEIKAVALEKTQSAIEGGDLTAAKIIQKEFFLAPEEFRSAVIKGYIGLLSDLSDDECSAKYIRDEFQITPKECKSVALEMFAESLKHYDIDAAIRIKKVFTLTQEDLDSPDIRATALEALSSELRHSPSGIEIKIDNILSMVELFRTAPGDLDRPEVRSAALAAFNNAIESGRIEEALTLRDKFHLALGECKSGAIKGCIKLLSGYHATFSELIRIRDEFKLSPEELNTPEIKSAVLEGIASSLFINSSAKDVINIIQIQNELRLSQVDLNIPPVIAALRKCVKECYTAEDIEKIVLIINAYNFMSEECRATAVDGLKTILLRGNIENALRIRNEVNLTPEEYQDTALEALKTNLSNGKLDEALLIRDGFSLSLEVVKPLVENLIQTLEQEEKISEILRIAAYFRNVIDDSYKESIFNQYISSLGQTERIGMNLLVDSMGLSRLRNILLSKPEFWNNVHDNLLFAERLSNMDASRKEETIKLILPLVSVSSDFKVLNELLGYFDIEKYKQSHNGLAPHFVNFATFEREAQLQRYNIDVPEDASDSFKDAITLFIATKGINVPFIRRMCDLYVTFQSSTEIVATTSRTYGGNYYPQETDEFAHQLIEILEGSRNIDNEKLIPPFEQEMSFDPVNKLVFNALGFHGLNNLSPVLREFIQENQSLGSILDYFKKIDATKRDRIISERDKKIAQSPDRKNRLLAETDKQIGKQQILTIGSSDKPTGIKVDNIGQFRLDLQTDHSEQLVSYFKSILFQEITSASGQVMFGDILVDALRTLGQKSTEIDNVFDLKSFASLVVIGQKLETLQLDIFHRIIQESGTREDQLTRGEKKIYLNQAKREVAEKHLSDLLAGSEIDALMFALYLSLNNTERQTRSKQLKNQLDAVLNQNKYKTLLSSLKANQTVAQNESVLTAYLKGQLPIDRQDEELLKQILDQNGYNTSGRSLTFGIARGSDYEAWVCGDATNCCMPFTSTNNQEYLLRPDTAYFTVKVDGQIIAQSVVILAKDPEGTDVIALDNIEIANNAIKYRSVIAKAYEKLKSRLVEHYRNQSKEVKIIVGTSYNDDGGTITGNCPLIPLTAQPVNGSLHYSDCFGHSNAYLMADTHRSEVGDIQYFGLAIDLFDRSRANQLFEDADERERVRKQLEIIGKGEDDGEGGLIFPDNHSIVIVERGSPIGYILAADYVTDDNQSDSLSIEQVKFLKDVSQDSQVAYLKEYLSQKARLEIDTVNVKKELLIDIPYIKQLVEEVWPRATVTEVDQYIVYNIDR